MLIKIEKKNVVFIYCTEQLNLKNISYWHYFTTKIMSICPIWHFTIYVTQSLHFFENHPNAISFNLSLILIVIDLYIFPLIFAHDIIQLMTDFCLFQSHLLSQNGNNTVLLMLLLKQQRKCKIICHFVTNGEHLHVFSQ